MFGRINQWLPAVAVGFLGVATARADGGYLPHAGPMALRFRVPPPPAAEHVHAFMAPPPPMPIALPAPSMPSAPLDATNATTALMVKPVVPTNGPALEFNAREPVVGPTQPSAPDGVISAQMLIKYFTPPANLGTNAPSVGAVVPVGFTPPSVAAPAPALPASIKSAPSTPSVVPK